MDKYIPFMYKKSVFDIDYEKLYSMGIRVLLFDLDNTLVNPVTLEVSSKLYELITLLKNDFKVIIISNSGSNRVSRVSKSLDVDFIYSAAKPSGRGFKKVLEKYNFSKDEMIIIGDQLLTDVSGGNRFGIRVILVDPLAKDRMVSYFNRWLENKKLKRLTREKKLERGKYYE